MATKAGGGEELEQGVGVSYRDRGAVDKNASLGIIK